MNFQLINLTKKLQIYLHTDTLIALPKGDFQRQHMIQFIIIQLHFAEYK